MYGRTTLIYIIFTYDMLAVSFTEIRKMIRKKTKGVKWYRAGKKEVVKYLTDYF